MTPLLTEDHWLNPIWLVRGFPAAAAILCGLSMFVFKSGASQAMCLGGALGLLIGMCAFSTGIKTVVLKDTPQPSDVEAHTIR